MPVSRYSLVLMPVCRYARLTGTSIDVLGLRPSSRARLSLSKSRKTSKAALINCLGEFLNGIRVRTWNTARYGNCIGAGKVDGDSEREVAMHMW